MERCLICRKGTIHEKTVEYTRKVAGYTLKAPITAYVCDHCQDTGYPANELGKVTLHMAATLAQAGLVHREAFRLMRDALGIKAADLAKLLGVAPNTVTRWETGNRSLDTASAAILSQMVLDAVGGPREIQDTLRAIQAPQKLPKSKGVQVLVGNPYQYATERLEQALLFLTSLSTAGEERLRWALLEFAKIDEHNFPKTERSAFFGKIEQQEQQIRKRLKEEKATLAELLPKMTQSEQDQLKNELVRVAQELGSSVLRNQSRKPAA